MSEGKCNCECGVACDGKCASENVVELQVPAAKDRQPLDAVHDEVGFEGMARPGRRDGAHGGIVVAVDTFHPLGGPEQPGKFLSGKRLGRILASADPAGDQGREIQRR